MAAGSKRRGRVFIYLALIILLVVVLVFVFLSKGFNLGGGGAAAGPAPTLEPAQETVDIVITTQNITRGNIITPDVLATIKYPKNEIVEGTFFFKVEEVVGKRARFDMDARVPVTSSMVVENSEGSFAAFQIPKGLVGITIPLKDRISAVSYAPQPGDHLNIIVTLQMIDLDTAFQTRLPNFTAVVTAPQPGSEVQLVPAGLTVPIISGGEASAQGRAEQDPTLAQPVYVVPSERQRARAVSQTLLQDVVVLQVGDFATTEQKAAAVQPTPTPGPDGVTAAPTPAPLKMPDTITVMVSPQDSVTLNYLIYQGAQLTLVLRGAGDDQRVQTESVTLQYLMDQYNIPLPAKLPYGLDPRVDTLALPSQYNIVNYQPTPVP